MSEQLQRLPRPTSALEVQEGSFVSPSRGINRSNLTLYFSIAAILLSVASAGVHLFTFLAGEKQQMVAKAALDSAQRELVAVQIQKEKQLARAAIFEADLKAQQITTSAAQEQDALASKQHHYQEAALARPQAQSAEYKAAFDGATIGDAEVRRRLADSLKGGLESHAILGLEGLENSHLQRGPGSLPGERPIGGYQPGKPSTDSYEKFAVKK